MKKTILLLLLIPFFFTIPVNSEDIPQNCVLLREYIDRIFAEKDLYYNSYFKYLESSLSASQTSTEKALNLSQVELDRRFVTIEKWINEVNKYNSQITNIERRLAIVETEGRWQATLWAAGVALFFTVIQIAAAIWNKKRSTEYR